MSATNLLALYHRLPVPARQLAVRLRGEYLRWWRFGGDFDARVDEAVAQETWPAERWQRWQEERVASLLHHAATRVPYYREAWAARRRRGDTAPVEQLSSWPLLEKEAIREHPLAFVVDGTPGRGMYPEHTSGSTGKPLDLWWSRDAVRAIYALNEAYCNRWYGVSRHDSWAMLGGQLIVPASQTRPPFWAWNGGLRQLYMSSYHLAPQFIPAYGDALRRYGVRFIAGYTSSLYQLALGLLDHGRDDLHLAVAFTHAEAVTTQQRRIIGDAFHAAVCETYGNAEAVSRASACPRGRLHMWPQIGMTEILDDDARPVPDGASGEIVSTTLVNRAMPLIRYRIGDRGTMAPPGDVCGCGRTLPVLASVDGRVEDTLYTRDGRAVQRLHGVFIGVPGVREAQVVQDTLDRVRLRCVTSPEFDAGARRLMIDKLRARMGPVEVEVELLDRIPVERNGKFRAVVCRLPDSERPRRVVASNR
jgi:phenylacetate-CoA ligase